MLKFEKGFTVASSNFSFPCLTEEGESFELQTSCFAALRSVNFLLIIMKEDILNLTVTGRIKAQTLEWNKIYRVAYFLHMFVLSRTMKMVNGPMCFLFKKKKKF